MRINLKEKSDEKRGFNAHFSRTSLKYAKELSSIYNADEKIVEITALLYDYADIKNSANREDHHIVGADEAEKLLHKYGYPQERINKIKECIKEKYYAVTTLFSQ